jgi:hypothetical protein
MVRIPVLPETAFVGALIALLRRSLSAWGLTALDPLLPLEISSVNAREGEKAVVGRTRW